MLEESAASVAHFAWLLFYAATTLLTIAPISSQAFLGTTLSSTLVYIWSRRNPDTRLSFLGLLTFKAPWLPWVLIGFNVVLHGNWPKDELCGIVVGHSKPRCLSRPTHDRMLTFPQSGISSTIFTQRHTTGTDPWIPQVGGFACLSVKWHCQILMCMTPPYTERLPRPRLPTFDDESYLASKQSIND
jgi:hypothetical protein